MKKFLALIMAVMMTATFAVTGWTQDTDEPKTFAVTGQSEDTGETHPDTTQLEAAIDDAKALPRADKVSDMNGFNVAKSKTWVSKEVNKALTDALSAAELAREAEEQTIVDTATAALRTAIENYKPVLGIGSSEAYATEIRYFIQGGDPAGVVLPDFKSDKLEYTVNLDLEKYIKITVRGMYCPGGIMREGIARMSSPTAEFGVTSQDEENTTIYKVTFTVKPSTDPDPDPTPDPTPDPDPNPNPNPGNDITTTDNDDRSSMVDVTSNVEKDDKLKATIAKGEAVTINMDDGEALSLDVMADLGGSKSSVSLQVGDAFFSFAGGFGTVTEPGRLCYPLYNKSVDYEAGIAMQSMVKDSAKVERKKLGGSMSFPTPVTVTCKTAIPEGTPVYIYRYDVSFGKMIATPLTATVKDHTITYTTTILGNVLFTDTKL